MNLEATVTKLKKLSAENTFEKIKLFREKPGFIPGISTGYPKLDRKLGGLQARTFTLLAARPKVGKSALVLNIVLNAGLDGKRVAFFSQEMSEDQLLWRLASMTSGIPGQAIREGFRYEHGVEVPLQEYEYELFQKGAEYATTLPIGLHVGGITTDAMWKVLEELEGRIDIAVTDHIGLHTDMPTASPYQRVTAVTRSLKDMKLRFNIPILGVAQLSRSVEQREDKRPQIYDLRDSGSAEQDADTILLMYRADYYVPQDDAAAAKPSDVELNVAANRDGPTGVVHFHYDRATQRFTEKGSDGSQTSEDEAPF